MKDQQLGPWTRRDGVSPTLVIAGLNEQRLAIQPLYHRADLPARQVLCGKIGEKRDYIQ